MTTDDNTNVYGPLSRDMSFVNKNPTDHERFKKFHKEFTQRIQQSESELREEERKKNLALWDEHTPARWRKARLARIDPMVAQRIVSIVKSSPAPPSLFFHGPAGCGKTYASYAAFRALVGKYNVDPTNVLLIPETDLMGFATSGYQGTNAFNDVMKRPLSGVIVTNAGNDMSDKEYSLTERFVDKMYTNNVPMMMTSVLSPQEWKTLDFGATRLSRMSSIFGNNVISMPPRANNSLWE